MRLIDADALKEKLTMVTKSYKPNAIMERAAILLEDVETAPTIEAELVIRCKDCNYCGEIDENGWHCCENLGVGMPKNGFCSDAERKEVG